MQRQFFANNKSADLNNNKRASIASKTSAVIKRADQWYPTSSTSQPGKKDTVVCNGYTNGIRDTKGVDLRYGANNMYCEIPGCRISAGDKYMEQNSDEQVYCIKCNNEKFKSE